MRGCVYEEVPGDYKQDCQAAGNVKPRAALL